MKVRITIIASPADSELRRISEKVAGAPLVGSLAELEALLERLPSAPRGASLDIAAHTTKEKLMRLGATVLDPRSAEVSQVVTRLRRARTFQRLGVTSLRLLGCRSACERGAGAVLAFADLVGLRVCGSTTDLRARHYDAGGFAPPCDVLLADDVVLRRRVVDARHGRLTQGATR